MRTIEQKVLSLIKRYDLIHPDDKILVALSGGPDSVFLINLLNKYKDKLKISLGTAHVNHLLRGKDSDDDEIFCKELSNQFNVPYFRIKIDIKKLAKSENKSIEEAARDARYSFLMRTAESNSYNKIATAHNINDNSETILLNLIKGTGLRGLAGIQVKRGKIIRPILNISKNEVLEYLKENNLEYRTDFTNELIIYERNYIRQKLLPSIKKLNPSIDKTLLNSSEIYRNNQILLDEMIQNALMDIYRYDLSGYGELDIEKLKSYNTAILGELFRKIIVNFFSLEFEFNDFKKIKSLIDKQTGRKIQLPKGLLVYRERDKLIFLLESESDTFHPIEIKVGETIKVDKMELGIVLKDKKDIQYDKNKFHELISADECDERFTIRRWQPGDNFIPLGMKNFKKISDFLTEQKISSYKRKNQLVLINKEKIVWLPGFRIDDRVKITNNTKRIFEIWLK